MAFTNPTPDFDRSPRTGMTRDGWIAAGKFLLEGVFMLVGLNPQPPEGWGDVFVQVL